MNSPINKDIAMQTIQLELSDILQWAKIDENKAFPLSGQVKINLQRTNFLHGMDGEIADVKFSKQRELLEKYSVHEEELFAWLSAAPENGKEFLRDPLSAIKKASSISDALLQELINTPPLTQYLFQDTHDHAILDQEVNDARVIPHQASNQWKTLLPKAGLNTTNLVVYKKNTYVGSNGYLYKIDNSTGVIQQSLQITNIGSKEIRLAISENGENIFAGGNGYVVSILASNFAINWKKELSKKGEEVNLLFSKNVLYAGNYGYVYKLGSIDGAELHARNNLSDRGNREVCLALSADQNILYVGTDGYGLALDADTIITKWQKSLAETGHSKVNVLSHGNVVFFGSDGLLYKIGANGERLGDNGLHELGKHEVRLSLSANGKVLYLGTNGYAVAINAENMKTIWQTSLSGTKDNVVSLQNYGDQLFIGSYGYFFILQTVDGIVTYKKNLECQGNNQVQLALSANQNQVMLGCNGYAVQLPAGGDLAAGWLTILAMRQSRANQTLASLYENAIIPKNLKHDFTINNKKFKIEIDVLESPIIVSGDKDHIQVQLNVFGKINSFESNTTTQLKIENTILLSIELKNIFVKINEIDEAHHLLSYNLISGSLFNEVNLSDLKISSIQGDDINLKNVEGQILEMMNNSFSAIFPMQHKSPFTLPAPLDQLKMHVNYTQVPNDNGKNFFSLLFSKNTSTGSFNLSPDLISDVDSANIALILSNDLIMNSLKSVIIKDVPIFSDSLAMENNYPLRIKNNKDIMINDVPGVWLRIDKNEFSINFDNQRQLHIHLKVSYINIATFGYWRSAANCDARIKFSCKNGNINIDVSTEGDTSGLAWMTILFPFLLPIFLKLTNIINKIIEQQGRLILDLPGFYVTQIATPAYIQISGKFK